MQTFKNQTPLTPTVEKLRIFKESKHITKTVHSWSKDARWKKFRRWVGLQDLVAMPRRPLPYTSRTHDSFQSLKSSLLLKVHGASLETNAVLVWIFPSDLLPSFACVPSVSRRRSSCLTNVDPATFAGNTIVNVGSLLSSTYRPSSHKWVSQGVPRFENSFNIVSVRYMFEILRHTSYIRYRKLLVHEQICINCFKQSGGAPFLTTTKILNSIHRIYLHTSYCFHHKQCLTSFNGINWLVSIIITVSVHFWGRNWIYM